MKKEITETDFVPALKITKVVQEKIRYMCCKYPTKEWSGVLFYKVKGSFEKENLILTTVDFLVLNIGSSTFTEYINHPEIAYFMSENGYEKYSRGLIHSHNTMPAFFSATDTNTLKKEGLDNIHYLSLIVNNDEKYVARITKRINNHISTVSEYLTFNGKIIKEYPPDRIDTTVKYTDVNILYPKTEHKFSSILDSYNRIKEEEDKKEITVPTKKHVPDSSYKVPTVLSGYYNYFSGREEDIEKKTGKNSDIILKRLLSLNIGLDPSEAKGYDYYINNIGRFRDIFVKGDEFLLDEFSMFVSDILDTLVCNLSAEETIDLLEEIHDGIDNLYKGKYSPESLELLDIIRQTVINAIELCEDYLENFQDEADYREVNNINKKTEK